MDIDTVGTFNVSRAAFPALKAAGGGKGAVIINISATLHYGATWYQAHASAAKAAIDSLTRSLGLEWGSFGIRVCGALCKFSSRLPPGEVLRRNISGSHPRFPAAVCPPPPAGIAPGPIGGTAGMTKLAPGKIDDIAKEVPLRRLGKTSDIALACVFLARPTTRQRLLSTPTPRQLHLGLRFVPGGHDHHALNLIPLSHAVVVGGVVHHGGDPGGGRRLVALPPAARAAREGVRGVARDRGR